MTPVATLASQIRPRERYLRAANLEVHEDQSALYIPTSRALEVLRRLVQAMVDPTSGRSWSLTGPYGAGKSSFALYIRALLGPPTTARGVAEDALGEADTSLLRDLVAARESLGAEDGFVLATATCQRESLALSLLRALGAGVEGRWKGATPRVVADALRSAEAKDARSIAEALRVISGAAPVLLVLDEFGKALEYFSERVDVDVDVTADLFVLQELAERSTGERALPLFTFTLQHLAFDDYVRHASAQQRREWGKVQGRFEDVSFVESAEQSLRLVAGALDDSCVNESFDQKRKEWAARSFASALDVGIANHLPGGAATVERCYPLHPVALLALPELCGRLGQHGRTLFSFLSGDEPGTARVFLESTPLPEGDQVLPVIGLPELFDFFGGAGQAMALAIGGSRWREIRERITEASGLDEADRSVLKSVGLLNLLGNSLGLRASPDVVSFSLSHPAGPTDQQWRRRLEDLESRGFLTFRSFADEYRLWQGSDVDLSGRVADAREQLRNASIPDILAGMRSDTPVIAARHSQEVGMLRYFDVAYSDDGSTEIRCLAPTDPADGLVTYHLGSAQNAAGLRPGADSRPIVLVTSIDAHRVRDAAIEVAAALAVLEHQEVVEDRVARRELQDRVADARNRLNQTFAEVFRPGAEGVEFRVTDGQQWVSPQIEGLGLSRLLSDVCDVAYRQSPHIRNEMLGRRDLTSQGAKARRLLIEAMITHPHEERLGLEGFGPERAMYEAVLRHTGLHTEHDGGWRFGPPAVGSSLGEAWAALTEFINAATEPVTVDKLFDRLTTPPIGLKEGPIPVLLVAHLLQRNDDVAIYEDGTFQPSLTVDLVERLVKTPQRCALKSFAESGNRAQVLASIARVTVDLGVTGLRSTTPQVLRNQTVLAVAAPLLNLVRGLNLYTRKTNQIGPRAVAVREALLTAKEPDQLLLVDLPAACGFRGAAWMRSAGSRGEFEGILRAALIELQQAFAHQLLDLGGQLAEVFHEPADHERLRRSLTARAEQIEDKVLDRQLKAFVFNVCDETTDPEGWLARIGLAITGKPVELWLDDDRRVFERSLMVTAASFQRVEALHADLRARAFEGGFTARRVAFTSPEGNESVRVLYYDDNTVASLDHIIDRALDDAVAAFGGPQGRDGFTARLLERVLGGSPARDSDLDRSAGRPRTGPTKESNSR